MITQALIEAGELDTVRGRPRVFTMISLFELAAKVQHWNRLRRILQLVFMYAFTGKHDHANCNLAASEITGEPGLKPRRSWKNLAYLEKKHFTEVGFLNGQTGDLLVWPGEIM